MADEIYSGPLILLMAKHNHLKAVCQGFRETYKKEEAEGATKDRLDYLKKRIDEMSARIGNQEQFFDKWTLEMTQEELHEFTGGYKDEAWLEGHPRYGRHS